MFLVNISRDRDDLSAFSAQVDVFSRTHDKKSAGEERKKDREGYFQRRLKSYDFGLRERTVKRARAIAKQSRILLQRIIAGFGVFQRL